MAPHHRARPPADDDGAAKTLRQPSPRPTLRVEVRLWSRRRRRRREATEVRRRTDADIEARRDEAGAARQAAGVNEDDDTAAAPTFAKMPGQDGDDSMTKGCRKMPTHRRQTNTPTAETHV
ncbi:hypothetical protein PVAP13_6KG109924 [Panicum virgatum]|uniref:Uncharacterized protein n=1 Tax=Panicum virgatum TaxID=38727 RepID=A0A8T0RAG4_PANVG|nr:hypothetical protein PVAP13_6KG109924 [Panicum virgatum]